MISLNLSRDDTLIIELTIVLTVLDLIACLIAYIWMSVTLITTGIKHLGPSGIESRKLTTSKGSSPVQLGAVVIVPIMNEVKLLVHVTYIYRKMHRMCYTTKITYIIHDRSELDNHRFVTLRGKPAEKVIKKIHNSGVGIIKNDTLIPSLLIYVDKIEEE